MTMTLPACCLTLMLTVMAMERVTGLSRQVQQRCSSWQSRWQRPASGTVVVWDAAALLVLVVAVGSSSSRHKTAA